MRFDWNTAKSAVLKEERGVSFEDVGFGVATGGLSGVMNITKKEDGLLDAHREHPP